MQNVYKIFLRKKDELRNLFKGIEGTRSIPTNEWLRAENKWARDGGGSRKYLTGIHVLKDREKAIEYLNNFRTNKDRVVVPCKAKELRQKPTNNNVFLANWLLVPQEVEKEVLNTDKQII